MTDSELHPYVEWIAREARRPDQSRRCAEFVGREKAGNRDGLDRERCFEFEKIFQLGKRRRVPCGQLKPIAQHRRIDGRIPGIGIAYCWMVEQIGKVNPVSFPATIKPSWSCLRKAVCSGP